MMPVKKATAAKMRAISPKGARGVPSVPCGLEGFVLKSVGVPQLGHMIASLESSFPQYLQYIFYLRIVFYFLIVSQILLYVKFFTRIIVNFFYAGKIFGKFEDFAKRTWPFTEGNCRGGGGHATVRK